MRRPTLLLALALSLVGCHDRPAGGAPADPRVPPPAGEPTVFPELSGPLLRDALLTEYAPDRTLGYGPARDVLFAYEVRTDGALEGVYTGFAVALPPGADESKAADELGINTEHVWPQSYGARDEPLRSDLHHLFPARKTVNSSRGNLPFGEVPDEQAEAWYRLGESQSNTPRERLDEWSERGAGRFEPRESREGDVARAVFYVYTVYRSDVEDDGGAAFFEAMLPDLLAWNDLDPPDAEERARSAWIAEQQGTPNPFVLDPTLARRAFNGGAGRPAAPPTATEPAADVRIAEIHYDNPGADVGEGIEIAGPAGAAVDGWSLALYNGSDGGVYRTVRLSGRLGQGAQWVGVDGLQNGAPDGLALVAPDGEVRQFLSYEGAFVATDGPAAGRRSSDVGAAQDDETPPGHSLQLTGGAWRLAPASPGRPNG